MPQMQISSFFIPLDESQKGFQLLQKLGWKKGNGLGKFQQGRLEPINPLSTHDIERICINSVIKQPTVSLPEITIYVKNIGITALIDSGSEITCISETLCLQLQRDLPHLPILPLKALQIQGAFSRKSRRIIRQVLLSATIENKAFDFCCLIVPDLLKPFIIGIDWLIENKCTLSLEKHQLQITTTSGMVMAPICFTRTIQHEEQQMTITPADEDELYDSCAIMKESKEELIRRKVSEADLEPEQKQQLYNLLKKFQSIFSEVPGLTHLYTHEMVMKDEEPIFKRSYPVPYALRPAVEAKLKEMEQMGIIERSVSAYSSPITIVKKKDGTVRICLDARGINEKLLDDTEAPPRTEELLQKFHGCTSLSSIDLSSSFWQLPLANASRKYTAFSYNGRTYVFKVLPFGLKTAVASFSRCIDIVLGPEVRSFTSNYIDDLLVASEDVNSHLMHLDKVFQRLKAGGMTVNLEKSNFVRKEVPFLGHVLTPAGIKMDVDKIASIRQFPRPTKIKHLRAFLGLCNFYKKFCQNYSHYTLGLRHLLLKKNKWEWGQKEDECFQNLKEKFIESVVLIHPDLTKEFHLDTDSSYYALGAVLYQQTEDGNTGVVAFLSRSLHGPELRYSVTEKELLAIVYSLQKSRIYLLGNKVTVRTDHKALTFLKHCRFVNDRMLRWQLFIQQFNLKIEHVKGSQNKVADILSRYPPSSEGDGQKTNPLTIATFTIDGIRDTKEDLRNLARHQRGDRRTAELIKIKQKQHNLTSREERLSECYRLHNGILLYKNKMTTIETIEVPLRLQSKLIWHYHLELGHFGPAKVYNVMKKTFHWKGMGKHIRRMLSTCDLCQKTKRRNQTLEGEMQPIIPNQVGDLVAVDYFGPLPPAQGGFKYLCVMMDVFSKYIKLFPMKRINAAGTLKHLREGLLRHIKVKQVLSDHGTQFTSRRWIDTLRSWKIRPVFITIRNPQSNPVERCMKTLGRFFRTYCHQNHNSWLKHIADIEECLNKTPHLSTQFAPIQIVTGIEPQYILQKSIEKYITRHHSIPLADLHDKVRRNLWEHANTRVRRQDKKHVWQFSIGDKVLLRINKPSDAKAGETKKFNLIYDGPFCVTDVPYKNVYEIRKNLNGEVFGRYNTRSLIPYKASAGLKNLPLYAH